MRNIDTKIDNTAPAASGRLKAAQWNSTQVEVETLASSAGLTLDGSDGPDTDLSMVAQAVAKYASGAIFASDSGVANAYVLSLIGTFQPPKTYFRGMQVVFYPGNDCTEASTINAFGIGVKKFLRPDASPLEADDVLADRLTSGWYDPSADGGSGAFRMAPWCLPVTVSGGGGDGYPQAGQGIAVNPSFFVALNFPSLTIDDPSDEDIFAFWDVSAGNHRGVTWGRMKQLLLTYVDGGVVGGGGPGGGGAGCTPAYVTGDRTASITASSSLTLASGAASALVNGSMVATWRPTTQSVVGKYIRFDFGTPKLITEARNYGAGSSGQNVGTWKWQVSTDASAWIDVGSTFALGCAAAGETLPQLSGNVTAYRYYQIVGVADSDVGSTLFDDPHMIVEFEFKQCG